jgi:cytochrome c oxidase cbb3-type subunit 3
MNPNPQDRPAEEPLRPHSYDGIREFDKRLPNWWLFTLYGAIVFWIGYWSYYEWFHAGASGPQQVEQEMAQIEAVRLSAMAATHIDDKSLWQMSRNSVVVAAGRATFTSMCVSCHKESLRGVDEGGIGADLRKQVWIHGGLPTQIIQTVTSGVLAKGMPTWGPILGQKKITEVVAYVLSYHQEGEPMSIQPSPPGQTNAAQPGVPPTAAENAGKS